MQIEEKITVENRNNGSLTFFIGIWLLGWCAITGTMIYALLFDNNGRYSFLFTILSMLAIIGYLIWNQFLWNINGRHILIFNSDHLQIKKEGTISFFPYKRVNYTELQKFDTTKSRKSDIFGKMWGFGGETLLAICTVRHFYLGAGWKIKDSTILAQKLNKILEDKKIASNKPIQI